MIPDVCTGLPEILREMFLPGKRAYRMRGKWDKIGGDPEKKQTMIPVVFQNSPEAAEILPHGFPQPHVRVGCQPERSGRSTSN
jgi:hypothetical protein